ncbi:putative vomeronasal type-2 receptor 26-like [Sesbania bispinosa]|nr:putative vomeronasal type-2 receptor 26-like [Sesbania bispinosa]
MVPFANKKTRGKKSRVLTREIQRFLAQRTLASQLKCFVKMLPCTTTWLIEVENLSEEVQTLTHGMALSDASFNETVVTLIAGLLLKLGFLNEQRLFVSEQRGE